MRGDRVRNSVEALSWVGAVKGSVLNFEVKFAGSSCSEYYTNICAGENGFIALFKSSCGSPLIVNKFLTHNLSLHIMQTRIEFEIQRRQRQEKT